MSNRPIEYKIQSYTVGGLDDQGRIYIYALEGDAMPIIRYDTKNGTIELGPGGNCYYTIKMQIDQARAILEGSKPNREQVSAILLKYGVAYLNEKATQEIMDAVNNARVPPKHTPS